MKGSRRITNALVLLHCCPFPIAKSVCSLKWVSSSVRGEPAHLCPAETLEKNYTDTDILDVMEVEGKFKWVGGSAPYVRMTGSRTVISAIHSRKAPSWLVELAQLDTCLDAHCDLSPAQHMSPAQHLRCPLVSFSESRQSGHIASRTGTSPGSLLTLPRWPEDALCDVLPIPTDVSATPPKLQDATQANCELCQ